MSAGTRPGTRGRLRALASSSLTLGRNLRALASGNDLVTQLDHARRSLDGQRAQAERVYRAMIDRHYGGWELPPPDLRLHVGAKDDGLNFWAKGISSSQAVLDVFGTSPSGPVLDWGCGSGRTLLWLRCYKGWKANYHGCDVDGEAIGWLRGQGVESVDVCGDLPPLPYPAGMFAGLFSFSVLTHIPPEHHRNWYEELARVLQRGGRALVTTHGAWGARQASEETRVRLVREGAAYEVNPAGGHYKDSSVVTPAFAREAMTGLFSIEQFDEGGYLNQDRWLLRRSSVAP